MPLEFEFTPTEQDDGEIDRIIVQPDQYVFLNDYSGGDRLLLAIHCHRNDSQGTVAHVESDTEIPTKETDEDIEIDLSGEVIATFEVSEGHPHEQEFIGKDDETGALDARTLSVRYVPGDEITRSVNIPLGLIYPN